MALKDEAQKQELHNIDYGGYNLYFKTSLSYNLQDRTTHSNVKNSKVWSFHHKIASLKKQINWESYHEDALLNACPQYRANKNIDDKHTGDPYEGLSRYVFFHSSNRRNGKTCFITTLRTAPDAILCLVLEV